MQNLRCKHQMRRLILNPIEYKVFNKKKNTSFDIFCDLWEMIFRCGGKY